MPKAIVKLDGEIIFFKKKMIEHLIVILIVFNLMVILRSILNGGWILVALLLGASGTRKLPKLNDIHNYILTTYYALDAKYIALAPKQRVFEYVHFNSCISHHEKESYIIETVAST